MATYTGALASNGLPELAEDGTVDFPAMTLQRALHVTLRDSATESQPAHVVIDGPVIVNNPDGSDLRVQVEGGGDTLNLGTTHAEAVAIVDAAGNPISDFSDMPDLIIRNDEARDPFVAAIHEPSQIAVDQNGIAMVREPLAYMSTAALRLRDAAELELYASQMLALNGGDGTYAEEFARGFELR